MPIEAGSAVVKCPNCGVVYHQSEERPCWTYADSCSMCARKTDLDAGFQWTPDGEADRR
jgi:hypothetical protein